MNIKNKVNPALALAALGVVYGDIGTSPLYTLQACFYNIQVSEFNILGVISLIFWALILVVSTCYLSIFLNASNDGEGGVLALLSLFNKNKKRYRILFLVGILGAGLLLSDGMLTPAVSVMGAMEGLSVLSPAFSIWTVPLTVVILLILFSCQRFGTQKIGGTFGPILGVWFLVIGLLGLWQIIQHPIILLAFNPYYALHFLIKNGFHGFLILGCVFLAITGAEALYADLGQFGKWPIRLSWFCLVLPCLILSFFGQGAHLLYNPAAVSNPFYYIAPTWFVLPLLILAAMATVIASQAIISASYSLAKQGILLGVIPRLKVVQTSAKEKGQIYVPSINIFFAIGCVFLVLFFKTANALTSAYGIAINVEMVIMAFLVICLAYQNWKWSVLKIISVFGVFVIVDLAFLASNIFKIISGGWMPLLFAVGCLMVMLTWYNGMALLRSVYLKRISNVPKCDHPHHEVLPQLTELDSIFITATYDPEGECFFHYFDNMQSHPKRAVLVTVEVHPYPFVRSEARFVLTEAELNIPHLTLHFGFMERLNIPKYLQEVNEANILPFKLDLECALYFIEHIALAALPGRAAKLFNWQKHLFIVMFTNTVGTFSALEFLKLPKERTVTIGTYAEL
ncbi:MAG: KUP/HAK/KT family potassium transporter [Gammaproteobacteria bacterium]|nr:KUP/HAK/KT family potassium transporter [Gammaproteobacteria bacterium]